MTYPHYQALSPYVRLVHSVNATSMLRVMLFRCTVEFQSIDTLFIQTPHYYGQFALSLGKESPYIFSKFNLLNTDTLLRLTFSMAPSVTVLPGFDCTVSSL